MVLRESGYVSLVIIRRSVQIRYIDGRFFVNKHRMLEKIYNNWNDVDDIVV